MEGCASKDERRSPRFFIVMGSMALEEVIIDDIAQIIREGIRDPGLLARPVRVVLPSRSLISHFGRRLVRHFPTTAAGISLHTLFGIAVEVMERAGEKPILSDDFLLQILVRRFAREEKELRFALDHLVDGYGAVVATVVDLLDAGFDEAHAEYLDERLSALEGRDGEGLEIMRARAVLRVARRTSEAMKVSGIPRTSMVIQRAKVLIDRDPDRFLPSRAIFIHGFSDATGVALDLIVSLMRNIGAWLYLNHPPDPSAPERPEPGIRFTKRFSERIEQVATPEFRYGKRTFPLRISMLRAQGASAEIRAVADRIHSLLKDGVSPESIALVGRDLTEYCVPIRTHFNRLGIPFSGSGIQGPKTEGGRRITALLELMGERMDAPTDRWLDAMGELFFESLPDIRLSFHALGAARLKDVVQMDLNAFLDARGDFPLPIRRGLEEGDQGGSPFSHRRRVPGSLLVRAQNKACKIEEIWENWPRNAPFMDHMERLRAFLQEGLGWHSLLPGAEEIKGVMERLGQEIPPSMEITYDELLVLLGLAFSRTGDSPLGGVGGGVQVLDVMEARGLTFQYLFIVGLNRNVFPRQIREDPIVPDRIRKAIEDILPDIPIKQRGYDEERYLFAQLVSSSPDLTISWQYVDHMGKPVSASPLVERMRLSRIYEEETVKSLISIPWQSTGGEKSGQEGRGGFHNSLKTAREHAIVSAVSGRRDHLEKVISIAIAEARGNLLSGGPGPEEEAISRARIAVLDEIDPDHRTPEGLWRINKIGPYFGFVGPVRERADPRRGDLYVTTIEEMATCPWRVFVERLIRITRPIDPMGPMPDVEPRLIGVLVHSVLDIIAGRSTSWKEGKGKGRSRKVFWPDEGLLISIVQEEAERILRDEGIRLKGLAKILAIQAMPYIKVACQQDWPEGGSYVNVIGTEYKGSVEVEDLSGKRRKVLFRADRVDIAGDLVRLTDYKTGRPISTALRERKRYEDFLDEVRRGKHLQGAAYALSNRGIKSEGRYLFLKPEIPDHARVFTVKPDDREMIDSFREVVKEVIRAWDEGSFFPRLLTHNGSKEPDTCGYCDVAQACIRGDSGARARLLRWVERENIRLQKGEKVMPSEEALLGLWYLGSED